MTLQPVILATVATIEREGVAPDALSPNDRYIGLEHIDSEGGISSTETAKSANLKSTKFRFSHAHVLFGKLRPYLRKIARPEWSGVCSTDILPILPGKHLSRDYLCHFLRTPEMVALATQRCAGANLPRLSPKQLEKFEIPLPHKNGKPDVTEQQRIAAILDKAGAIRRKRQQAFRLTDDFLRSVFLDMFGDPVTNPKGWNVTTAGEQLEFLTSGSRGWAQYYTEDGDLFIRIQNLRGGLLDLSDAAYVNAPESAEATRTRVRQGDVLLSITADLGRTAVVPNEIGKAHINQHIAILRLHSMNPVFVAQLLASPGGQRQFETLNKSAVKAGLNFDDIRSIKLLNPPPDLQAHFALIVDQLTRSKGSHESARNEAEAAFTSLQQRAFRGEL